MVAPPSALQMASPSVPPASIVETFVWNSAPGKDSRTISILGFSSMNFGIIMS